ncbi:MAG: carbon storage regulator CsrA [Acidobacteriota bacterium]
MLVVTRKRDEAIIIGHDIEVRVLRVGRDGVRLGVVAPAEVPVYRTEIYDLVVRENRAAIASPSTRRFVDRIRRPASPRR